VLQSDKACAGAALPVEKTKGFLGASASSSEKSGGFFEDTPKLSIRDTLLRIRRDVEICLAWLDSGPSPLSSGLLDPSNKTSAAGFNKVRAASPPKKKPKFGALGSRPKIIFFG
jgi:hypothetical protein